MATIHPSISPVSDAARARPREDLIRLPGGRWSLWSCAGVRGAGFPASDVLRLASPTCARLVARLLNEPKRRPASSSPALVEAFASETRRLGTELRTVARDAAFGEAVLWQNRRAFAHGVAPLAAESDDDGGRHRRQRELLVASYLQRYCVKNDSIGFFGPVGWARISEAPMALSVTCGTSIVAARAFYLESWGIDALARTFDSDPALRAWRVPRLLPFVRLEGTRLMVGSRVARELSLAQARLCAACDGERPAQAIAREMPRWPGAAFAIDEDVYALLEEWQAAGYLVWSFEGPREFRAEQRLRERLARIEEAELRTRALQALDEIESAARTVQHSSGDCAALDRAMQALESTFTRVTGASPTRREGQIYASRTLAYEDCRRDVAVEIGADLLARLGPPLSLLLHSARWVVQALAQHYATEFRVAFEALTRGVRRRLPLGVFLSRLPLMATPPGTLPAAGHEVRAALQQRWASVLLPPPAARALQYRSRDLYARVQAAFEVTADALPSWGRAVSPDVMIDASGVDAIERGDYRLVLGELHLLNTLQRGVFLEQHPCPDDLIRALDLDGPEPRVVWSEAKITLPERVHLITRPRDFSYSVSRDPSPVPAARTLRTADLEVVDEAGTLVVQTRDGRHRFPCLEFFGCLMMQRNVNAFDLLPPAAHRPRVMIDDVVVCREQWRVTASEITFASHGDDLERFVDCQRWRRRLELPTFAFVKLPTERKPSYIDFSSPVYVDLFARAVRALQRADPAAIVTLTEMLPSHEGAWLVDAAGQRYTSELRLVAIVPNAPPSAA